MRLPVQKAEKKQKKPELLTPTQILEKRSRNEISADAGVALLDRFIRQAFPDEKLKQLLVDLSEANDVKYAKGEGFYKTPNWNARRDAFRDAMKILKKLDDPHGKAQRHAPSKVVFNVVYSGETRSSEGTHGILSSDPKRMSEM